MKLRVPIGVALVTALALLTTSPAQAATTVEVVTPADVGPTMNWHTADTRPPGTLTFGETYGGAIGDGEIKLDTPTSTSKVQLFTDAHDGTFLRDITELSYSTYQDAPTGVVLPAINMRIDRDNSGTVDAYLVYEPYQDDAFYGNAAIQNGVWQNWDAWHGGASEWWSGQIPACSQSTPCTINALLALYPDAVIQEDTVSVRSGSTPVDADFQGSFGINQGSGNAGAEGAADALHLKTSTGTDVTYDFELNEPVPPPVVLTSKDQCKKGGWETSTAPVFKNQGDCVSSFASKNK